MSRPFKRRERVEFLPKDAKGDKEMGQREGQNLIFARGEEKTFARGAASKKKNLLPLLFDWTLGYWHRWDAVWGFFFSEILVNIPGDDLVNLWRIWGMVGNLFLFFLKVP